MIRTYSGEATARIAQAVLEANGIPSVISGDGASAMEPQLQYIQGVRLLVRADQAAEAMELLDDEAPTAPQASEDGVAEGDLDD